MRIQTVVAVAVVAAALGACAGQPGGNWIGVNTPNDIGSLPNDYKDQAVAFVKSRLKDPYSAVISNVSDGYPSQCAIGIYGAFHGWLVRVDYNAKNSFGGYVGDQPAFVWFANGTIRRVSENPTFCP